jgi:hypothetical protein
VKVKILLFIWALGLLLGACAQATEAAPTAVPTNTLVPTPTFTATPSTPLAILVLPADMDQALSTTYQNTVYALAQQSGFRFQVRNTLIPSDLTDSTLKIVIVLPPDPGVAAWAAAMPQTQFLVVNVPNINAGGNISILSPNTRVEIPAFMAGYLGAMLTEDYHLGMLLPKDDPTANAALQSFKNGMVYFCGSCKPFRFPGFCLAENLLFCYPQVYPIPSEETADRYGGYANYLINDRDVDTLFVYPSMASDDFLIYLGTLGVMQVGVTTPNPRPAGWIATIQPDVMKAVQVAWGQLAAGQGGLNVQSPLGLTDVDPGLLPEGKLQNAQMILDALIAGQIAP